MKGRIFLVAIGALLLAQGIAQAATEPASISYRRVYELLYQFRTLPPEDTDHLRFLGRIVNAAGPAPSRFTLSHDSETIAVDVSRHGLFDIPMSPQLAQINPRMLADPPEGILRLGLAIVIRAPEEGALDLAWLREGIRQTNAVMRARARVAPERVPQASGVTLRFAPGSETQVVRANNEEEDVFTPDEEGRINLEIDAETTSVTIGEMPEIIFPLFD